MEKEFVEFTAEEMKGCPSFEFPRPYESWRFSGSDGENIFIYREEVKHYDVAVSKRIKTIELSPEDRMKAICKQLFDFMPALKRIIKSSSTIDLYRDEKYVDDRSYITRISIDPFLHTGRKEITRAEVMNEKAND